MKTILLERRNDVLFVTINRPQVRNAFDEVVIAELSKVFSAVDSRVAVLRGAGKAFCAGADVDWMRRSVDRTEEGNRLDADRMTAMYRAINEAPCPVIASVHGAALGGGIGLVSCCDMAIAEEGTKFAFSEVRLGILPAVISSFALRKIGESAARRYFLTAELFGAREAKRIGLIHDVVPPGGLDARVDELVGALLRNGPRALVETKKLIRSILPMSWDQALPYASATTARVRVSEEGQEGLRAFLEKRKPSWNPDSR